MNATPTTPRSMEDLDRLRIVLLRAARRIRNQAQGDITPSQLAVLSSVCNLGPLTVGRIAELEHVQPPSASKIVAALEQSGLVERRTNPDDRRCASIVATAAGQAHLDEVRALGRSWLATRLDALDHDELATLESALPVLERLVETDS